MVCLRLRIIRWLLNTQPCQSFFFFHLRVILVYFYVKCCVMVYIYIYIQCIYTVFTVNTLGRYILIDQARYFVISSSVYSRVWYPRNVTPPITINSYGKLRFDIREFDIRAVLRNVTSRINESFLYLYSINFHNKHRAKKYQ